MGNADAGTLTERPLGSLIHELSAERFTGLVRIEGSVERVLALSDGRLYLATSAGGPSLHRILVGTGVVDQASWDHALADTGDGDSLLAGLIARGADRIELADTVRELTVGTILELLVPDEDAYRLEPGMTHRLGAELSFDVDEVLAEAGDRLDRWTTLQDRVPSLQTHLRRAPNLPPHRHEITLDRTQWRILDALDRPVELATLIDHLGHGGVQRLRGTPPPHRQRARTDR